jgi:cytochrome c553
MYQGSEEMLFDRVHVGELACLTVRPTACRLAVVCAMLFAVLLPVAAQGADLEAGRRKAEACVACHGRSGNSTIPARPSLAGQPPLYTFLQLIQFREKRRTDPEMSPMAAGLSETDMQDLAAYFAAQTPVTASEGTDPDKAGAGQRVAEAHHCASCHGPGLLGQEHIPRLAGLHYEYLLKQLRGFKAQTRADVDGSMTTAAQPLSDTDIDNLAHYMARLSVAR